jgi:peptidoglycan-associated lipoprotein
MKFLLKRSSILILLVLVVVSVSCRKNPGGPPVVPLPSSAPPPPPPTPNPGPPPTITLRADNTTITAGQSATLTYTATNATTVTIDPGVGAVQPATGGTRQVTPTTATTYTATAVGPGGRAQTAGVTITVNSAVRAATPPPASPVAPPTNNRGLDVIFQEQMVPILFDYDKSNIRADQERPLLNAASWLKQNATVRFQIDGHADERGGQEYNIALADERAAAVKKYLAGQGIAENRMTTVSFGEERPICREQTESCFQKNRRAAFTRIP